MLFGSGLGSGRVRSGFGPKFEKNFGLNLGPVRSLQINEHLFFSAKLLASCFDFVNANPSGHFSFAPMVCSQQYHQKHISVLDQT